jgi:1-aminocyclopropane-1-carboxylate deaminase/D-cysteine desulfhydrase-like pyridoxal-dependent ACC family enzyme
MGSSNDDGDDVVVEILIKREDLISNCYGGNKVRTLQHQLAVCEVRRDAGETSFQQLVSLGSGGSNQVVATVVHARKLGWDNEKGNGAINVCWFDKDEPDLDNTLNMLSVFSFSNIGFTVDWGTKVGLLKTLSGMHKAWTQKEFVPMAMGGNCPVGVIGQAGGILELAEQIQAGTSPDPDRIYIPIGSGCTISGLILGVCLARELNLKVFMSPDFKIVGCNVHEGFALLDRIVGIHTNPLFKFMPLTITHSVVGACRALKQIGGPDLEEKVMAFIKSNVEIRADAEVVGIYGGHSEKSREAANHYDDKGVVLDYKTGEKKEGLWVCGHFVAKAFHPLMKDMEAEMKRDKHDNTEKVPPKFMLWMTKSAVQPLGNVDEWSKFTRSNDAVKKWAREGKAESTLRPGNVSTDDGSKAEDYRSIMTKIL